MLKKRVEMWSVVFLLLLCGCGKRDDTVSQFDSSIYERPGVGHSLENYQECKDDIVLLKTYEDYSAYVNPFIGDIWSEECSAELLGYEEDYFEENMLIVINHWEETGSSDIYLYDIVYEETNIEVILQAVYPDACTDDMEDYCIIIRLQRDDNYTTAEYSVIEEYAKKWYECW